MRLSVDAALSVLAGSAVVALALSLLASNSRREAKAASVESVEDATLTSNADTLRTESSSGDRQPVFIADGRPRVVLVLSTTCDACVRSTRQWKRLAREVGAETAVLAVATESEEETAGFISEVNVIPLRMTGGELRRTFSVALLPTTIITAGDGTVAFAKVGLFSESARVRVLSVLDSLRHARAQPGASNDDSTGAR